MTKTHRATFVSLIGLALLLAGCSADSTTGATSDSSGTSSGSQRSDGGSSTSGSSASGTSADSASANGVSASSAAEAGIDPAALQNPIASNTITFPIAGDPKSTLKIDVLALRRSGKIVTLALAMTPTYTASAKAGTGSQTLTKQLGYGEWRPYAIDTKNLTQHDVAKTGEGSLSSAANRLELVSGQPVYAYAVFAAPPDDVTAMDLVILDEAPAFRNVPLS